MALARPTLANRAFDGLKAREGLASDAALAAHLGVSRQMVSAVRTGNTPLPRGMLNLVLDGARYAITRSDLLSLLPPEAGDAVRVHDNVRFGQRLKMLTDLRCVGLLPALDRAVETFGPAEVMDALDFYCFASRYPADWPARADVLGEGFVSDALPG